MVQRDRVAVNSGEKTEAMKMASEDMCTICHVRDMTSKIQSEASP